MPSRIAGIVFNAGWTARAGSGVSVIPVASDGTEASGVLTDLNGVFVASSLPDKSWAARLASGDGNILFLTETIADEPIHGQRSGLQAHALSQIRDRVHGLLDHAGNIHPVGKEPSFRQVFVFPAEDLAVGVLIPRPSYPLFGQLNTVISDQGFTATADTAGTGTNTIKLQSTTTNPFTGSPSWTDRATLELGTTKRAWTVSFSGWVWAPATEYLRVYCSAVGGTAPKEVVAYFDGRANPP